MRVLLVDDDATVRAVIRRMLRPLELDFTECQNGLEALELLSRERFAFAMLDWTMPVLDGGDTLRAIRESPTFNGLPVVMMTAVTDMDKVKGLLALGLSAYIVKPLRYERVFGTIKKLIETIREETVPGREADPVFRPLEISPESTVMIADGSVEFREFFRRQLAGFCTVRQEASGIAALRACIENPPAALFVGSDLGVLSSDLLARRVVEAPDLGRTRVVGVLPANLARRGSKGTPYETLILRTFVAESFLEAWEALLRRPGRLAGLLKAVPDLKLLAIGTFEETLRTMLSREAVARTPKAKLSPRSASAGIVIRLGIERAPLQVDLGVSRPHLDKLSALMVETGIAFAGDEPDAPLRLLLDRTAESLAKEFRGRALEVDVGIGRPRVGGVDQSLQQQDDAISVEFDVVGTGIRARLDLTLGDEA